MSSIDLYFLRQFFSLNPKLAGIAGVAGNPPDHISASLIVRLRIQATLIGIYMGVEEQHPDPHALSGSTLPTVLALLC